MNEAPDFTREYARILSVQRVYFYKIPKKMLPGIGSEKGERARDLDVIFQKRFGTWASSKAQGNLCTAL